MGSVALLIVATKTLTLALGGLVTYRSYSAYRRTAAPALLGLSVGFGIITIGALSAGILDAVLPVARTAAVVVESVFTIVGFAAILYSVVG